LNRAYDKEGLLHIVHDEKSIRKTYQRFKEITTIFEGMYQAIVNDSIEPVTAQDGIREIIEAAIKARKAEKKVIDL
jgi:hypothetical protein